MIDIMSVSRNYSNNVTALDGVSLRIAKGEFVFLVGQSGAGKSTLLKMIYREEKPSSGHILVAGFNLSKIRRKDVPLLRRNLGVVFQDYRLLPDRTVFDNVAFALRVIEVPRRDMRRRTLEVLERVGLRHRAKSLPGELSGGEQQRVAIARAIVNNPAILLADEPTGNLDPETSQEIMNLFCDISFGGCTVVVATHASNLVDVFRKRVVALEHGRITRDELRGAYASGC
jgi:cell division transport system ATP-binding protein